MADIPINPVTRRVEFTGNTGTGPFAFTFNVLAQADIAAYKNNTLLALTSDYTVSLNSNGTGSITLASALIATDELVIIGDLALSRTTDFVTAGDLLASSLNEQFDSNVVMSQQLDERFDRTIRSQPGDINKNLYLPLVSSRASQLLSFDSSGNITTTSLSNVPDIGTVNLTVSGVASFADGSASAPSITNIGDTNTGMYFGAADQINFSIGGSEVISVASTGTTISGLSISSGDILLTDNSATALEIKEGSNNYLTFITTNGSEKLSFGSTANPTFEVNGSFRQPLIAATTSFFSQTYSGATLSATNGAVNIESYSASKAGIVLNGSGDQITFTSPTLGFVGLVQVVGAITTNTSLNIASSTTVTGILDEDDMSSNSDTKLATQQSIKAYVDAQVGTVDTLAEVLGNGNTTGGTNIVVSANDVISLDDGTNALPSLTTTGDLNTGIYFPAADEVGVTTGGTQRVKVDSTGVNVTGTVTVGTLIDTPDIETSTVSARDGTTSFSIADSTGTATFNNSLTISRNSGTGVLPTLDIICTDNTAIQNQILGALDFQTSDTNEAGTLASIQARKTNSTSASTNLAALELYTGRPGDLIKAVTINADQTTSFAAAIDVTGTVTATGTSVFASLDISGDIDVDGTTNLDATNIVGALDVTGTITSDGLTVKNPNVSGEQVIFKIENAANTGTIGQITYNQTDDSMAISNESTGILRFDTTAKERMRISSDGDISFYEDTGTTAKLFWDASEESLGIGTSSPDRPVHLSSAGTRNYFKAETTGSANSSESGFEIKTPSSNWLINSLGGTDALIFYDLGNTSEAMRIDSSGDLTVKGGRIFVNESDNGNTAIGLTRDADEGYVQVYSAGSITTSIRGNGASYFNGGNVGIGTDSPTNFTNGTVVEAAGGTNTGAFLASSNNGTVVAEVQGNNADSLTYFGSRTNHPVVFRQNGSERMRIDSSGNVGIGTSLPSAPLHLVGSALVGVNDFGAYDKDDANLLISNGNNGTSILLHDGSGAYHSGLVKYDTNVMSLGLNNSNDTNSILTSKALNITSTGVGIGVTPQTDWTATITALQIGPQSVFRAGATEYTDATFMGTNVKQISGTNKYIETGAATEYYQQGGVHFWNYAASGTAGNTISFSEAMRIDSNGNLIVGGTSDGAASSITLQHDGDIRGVLASGAGGDSLISAISGVSNGYQITVDTSNNQTYKWYNGGTQSMTLDSSGNLLVGVSSSSANMAGIELAGNGQLYASTSSSSGHFFNISHGSDGNIVSLRKDGATVGMIFSSGGIQIGIGDGDTALLFGDNIDAILPWSASSNAARDDAIDLGRSATRFDDIYATNGTIQTSDRNEKQDIAELTDAEQRVAVAAKGLLRKFRWKDAVAEKGNEARTHFGIIAQDLQAAFAAEGLNAGDYAMFISSTWTDEDTGEERTRMGVRYSELLAFIIAAI
jgi:hypothetical protein